MPSSQWEISGALTREPEKMREWALGALHKLLDLPEDRLIEPETILLSGDEFNFQFVNDPTEAEFYDLTWSARETNVFFIMAILVDYSISRMATCFSTRENGDVLDTCSFDERFKVNEEPLSIEEASILVRGFPIVPWRTFWERSYGYDGPEMLGRPVSATDV